MMFLAYCRKLNTDQTD